MPKTVTPEELGIVCRGPYSPRIRVALDFSKEPNITNQSDAKSCDLNAIIKAHLRGEINPRFEPGTFADVSNLGDYREMRERIRQVEQDFSQLPAETRERFNNDPAQLLDALVDPTRQEELTQLGLFQQPEGDDAPGATPPPPPTAPPAASTGAGTTP